MTTPSAFTRRVFLSYAWDDAHRANVVAEALANVGIAATPVGPTKTHSADALRKRIADAIRSSDLVIVLVSAAAAGSKWTAWELELVTSGEFEQRGVDVIPALLDEVDLPAQLSRRKVVDLSGDFEGGVRTLVRQVQTATRIDFKQLGPMEFEQLVADLLAALGLTVTLASGHSDPGIDLKATRRVVDPFGDSEIETWLVECKLYGRERASVDAIRRMAAQLMIKPPSERGLLVTNSRITSVAHEYLSELEESGRVRLRVLDGTELAALLRGLPDVVARNFSSPRSEPDARA